MEIAKEAAITREWDITKLITTNDVDIDNDHNVRLNEKGALRVTVRFIVAVLTDCDQRELIQDERQKIVKLMDDVKEVMLRAVDR